MAHFFPALFLLIFFVSTISAAEVTGSGNEAKDWYHPKFFFDPRHTNFVTNETHQKLVDNAKGLIIALGGTVRCNKMCDCADEEGKNWLPWLVHEAVAELNWSVMKEVADTWGLLEDTRKKRSAPDLRLKRQASENSAVSMSDMMEPNCERMTAALVGMYGVCAKEVGATLSFEGNLGNAMLMCEAVREIFNTFDSSTA